jgi:membrane protein implicated in regulation of membrane protease activity
MRRLLSLKLSLLMVLWTVLCAGLYVVLAAGEAALELGGSAADFSGVADLAGDAVQVVLGAVWVIGLIGLWIGRRVVAGRQRKPAIPVAPRPARRAAPFMRQPRSTGMTQVLSGPNGRMLSRMLGRKS